MSKNEVVLLATRCIAIVQFISAIEEISYLPERFMALHHYGHRSSWLAPDYLTSIYSLEVSMLFFRIAGLLVLTWVFWKCAPWLRQIMWADQKKDAQAEEGSSEGY